MLENIESKACDILKLYPVKKAAFFGSAARGDITDTSDIDVIVEFLPDTRGIIFFGLHSDLQEALSCHVDLITYDALYTESKPGFKENVLREARVIYEREN
jgi:predicted nucleotidyltransferase